MQAVKRTVKNGRIGRILSSSLVGDIGRQDSGKRVPLRYRYFNDSSYGGNFVTIYFGHSMQSGYSSFSQFIYSADLFIPVINYVTYDLGELESFSGVLENLNPVVDLVDDGKVVETGVQKDTDDEIVVQGKFVTGAVMSIHLRIGQPFPGTPGLQWHIVGEEGEILVTATKPYIQLGVENLSTKLYDTVTGSVEDISIPDDDKNALPVMGQNIARLYDAFAEDSSEYATFHHAIVKHRLIDELFRSSKEGRRVSYEELQWVPRRSRS